MCPAAPRIKPAQEHAPITIPSSAWKNSNRYSGSQKKSSGSFQPATGPATLCAIFVQTNAKGFAERIESVRVGGRLKQNLPEI